MSDPAAITALRMRLSQAGLTAADADWFSRIGWSDAAVPAVDSDAQSIDYQRREAALNVAAGSMSFAERAASLEGKLAAAIGARVADWNDRADESEE